MIDAMDDFSDLFTTLVRSFLASSSIHSPQFDKQYEKQRSWYAKLRASLAESKYEYYLLGKKEEFLLMHRLVERMEVTSFSYPLIQGTWATFGWTQKCGDGTKPALTRGWTQHTRRESFWSYNAAIMHTIH